MNRADDDSASPENLETGICEVHNLVILWWRRAWLIPLGFARLDHRFENLRSISHGNFYKLDSMKFTTQNDLYE